MFSLILMMRIRLKHTGVQIITSLSGRIICKAWIHAHGMPLDLVSLKAFYPKVGINSTLGSTPFCVKRITFPGLICLANFQDQIRLTVC